MRATNMTVQGLAPFGADIAVLVHNPALNGSSPRPPNNLTAAAALSGGTASDATGVSTELQHEPPELKIFTWAREEVAADALFFITGTCCACKLAMLCIWCCLLAGEAPHADQHAQVHIITSWLLLLLCLSEMDFCWALCHTALYVAHRPAEKGRCSSMLTQKISWLPVAAHGPAAEDAVCGSVQLLHSMQLNQKLVLHLQTQLVHLQRGAWEARRCPAPDNSICL